VVQESNLVELIQQFHFLFIKGFPCPTGIATPSVRFDDYPFATDPDTFVVELIEWGTLVSR
jgi:hypothetical protein